MNKLIINTDDILYNLKTIRSLTDARIIAVVKGNGYGLGAVPYATLLYNNGVTDFAVCDLREAIELRTALPDADILLLQSDVALADNIVEHSLTAAVGGMAMLNALLERGYHRLHIELDTGFGRYGFHADEMQALRNTLSMYGVTPLGTFTHLSNAFSINKTVDKQYTLFHRMCDELSQGGQPLGLRHIVSSHGFILYPHMHCDAVRIGSALLGRVTVSSPLRRVGHLESHVGHIATLSKGHNIGYGNCYTAKADMTVAVVPIGYIDGAWVERSSDTFRFTDILRDVKAALLRYRRKLYVTINNRQYPIVGRICMCNIMVAIDGNVHVGDAVKITCNPLYVAPHVERVFTQTGEL